MGEAIIQQRVGYFLVQEQGQCDIKDIALAILQQHQNVDFISPLNRCLTQRLP